MAGALLLAMGALPSLGWALVEGRAAPAGDVQALLDELGASEGEVDGTLTRGLIDLGPLAIGPFLGVLSAPESLSGPVREAVDQALERIPAEIAARRATDEVTGDAERRERLVALALLRERGRAAHLATAVRLACPAALDTRYHRDLGRAVEDALGAILARDERALGRVRSALGEAHPLVRERLIRALGATRADVRGLELLGDLLGRYPDQQVTILSEIVSVTSIVRGPFEWSLLHRVRTGLDDPNSAIRRAAVNCLGRMEDHESVSMLVELLADESRGVRECAGWALERITRKAFGTDAERWRVWLVAESRWWRSEAPDLLGTLERGTDVQVIAALAKIAGRRLYRDELATAVVASLGRREGAVLQVACSTLQGLGSPCAIEALIDLLDHTDPGVEASAQRALTGITGRTLPPDSGAWRRAVSSAPRSRAIVSRASVPTADED